MLPRKFFENLHIVMVILVLFKNFQAKLVHTLSLFDCFIKYDVFCSHSFDYACLRRLRHIVMKRFEITEKFYSSKALMKMAGGGDTFAWFAPVSMVSLLASHELKWFSCNVAVIYCKLLFV